MVVGTILPYLAQRDTRLLTNKTADEDNEDEDEEISRIRAMVRSWKAEAARMGRPLHLPAMPFMLRNIWTGGLLLFGLLMMSTFAVRTVWQATLVVALVGISWAIACWVPFAIIMEVMSCSFLLYSLLTLLSTLKKWTPPLMPLPSPLRASLRVDRREGWHLRRLSGEECKTPA